MLAAPIGAVHLTESDLRFSISASFNAMALNPTLAYAAVRGSALDRLDKNSAGDGPMKRQPTNQV